MLGIFLPINGILEYICSSDNHPFELSKKKQQILDPFSMEKLQFVKNFI